MKKENVKRIRLLSNMREVGIFERLKMFKDNNNVEAKPTDFALLTGAALDKFGFTIYWTDVAGHMYHSIITSKEYSPDKHYSAPKEAITPAIRPVLEIEDVPNSDYIYFGEYPQFVEKNSRTIERLNRERSSDVLYNKHTPFRSEFERMVSRKTGKKWIINGKEYPEFEYLGNRYIGYVAQNDGEILSDGTKIEKGKIYWIKVSPLLWRVDKDKKILVSEYCLLSGVKYWLNQEEMDYNNSNMKNVLEKEMLPNIIDCKEYNETNESTIDSEDLSPKSILAEYGGQKVDEMLMQLLKEIKHAVLYKNLSTKCKEAIANLVKRKKELASLEPGNYKDLLIQMLFYDFLAIDYYIRGSYFDLFDRERFPAVSDEKLIDIFNEKIKTLIKIFPFKYTEVKEPIEYITVADFIEKSLKKINEIQINDPEYIDRLYKDRWENDIKSSFDEIEEIILSDDKQATKLKNAKQRYDIYRYNNENSFILALDIDKAISEGSPYNSK